VTATPGENPRFRRRIRAAVAALGQRATRGGGAARRIIASVTSSPDPAPEPQPLTQLLRAAATGEVAAADAVLPLVYRELRRLAQARMAGERADHTLQATALVHETWLKLVGVGEASWQDRAAFYHAAATAMRRILVDHARQRGRQKRGGGRRPEPITLSSLPAQQPDLGCPVTFLQLDEEIARLEREDPRAGAIVRLRFFAGLDVDETATMLRLSRRTVMREWAWARARLFAALSEPPDDA
jgi:RNA polymerase sigma factor (TIGR02999 family)